MSEPIFVDGLPASAPGRRVRPMIVALVQAGCVGLLVAQPVHAVPRSALVVHDGAVTPPVLYLAQANSDYSKMPSKRPPPVVNPPEPKLPPGVSAGEATESGGSGTSGNRPTGGTSGNQKR